MFDQNGAFTVEGIAPSGYHLYAFEDLPDGSRLNSDLRAQIEPKGLVLHFEEGDTKSIEVSLIGRSELSGPWQGWESSESGIYNIPAPAE